MSRAYIITETTTAQSSRNLWNLYGATDGSDERTRGREPRHKSSRIRPIIGEALLFRRIRYAIPDTSVTGRKYDRNSTSTCWINESKTGIPREPIWITDLVAQSYYILLWHSSVALSAVSAASKMTTGHVCTCLLIVAVRS